MCLCVHTSRYYIKTIRFSPLPPSFNARTAPTVPVSKQHRALLTPDFLPPRPSSGRADSSPDTRGWTSLYGKYVRTVDAVVCTVYCVAVCGVLCAVCCVLRVVRCAVCGVRCALRGVCACCLRVLMRDFISFLFPSPFFSFTFSFFLSFSLRWGPLLYGSKTPAYDGHWGVTPHADSTVSRSTPLRGVRSRVAGESLK